MSIKRLKKKPEIKFYMYVSVNQRLQIIILMIYKLVSVDRTGKI